MLDKMEETAKEITQKIKNAATAEEARAWAECLQALMTAIGIANNLRRASS